MGKTDASLKTIDVVAAIICRDGYVLATQRGYGDFAGGWEFPGGKIEAGETPEEALVREIHEELDCSIEIQRYIRTAEYDYETFHLSMRCYLCSLTAGEDGVPHLLEHSAAKWVDSKDIDSLDWLPADWQIIDELKANRVI